MAVAQLGRLMRIGGTGAGATDRGHGSKASASLPAPCESVYPAHLSWTTGRFGRFAARSVERLSRGYSGSRVVIPPPTRSGATVATGVVHPELPSITRWRYRRVRRKGESVWHRGPEAGGAAGCRCRCLSFDGGQVESASPTMTAGELKPSSPTSSGSQRRRARWPRSHRIS